MNRTQILFACITLAILFGAAAIYVQNNSVKEVTPQTTEAPSSKGDAIPKEAQRTAVISTYVAQNINKLSPVPAASGSPFFAKKMTFDNGTGTVEYSDGKKSYIADFRFSLTSSGSADISEFKLRK